MHFFLSPELVLNLKARGHSLVDSSQPELLPFEFPEGIPEEDLTSCAHSGIRDTAARFPSLLLFTRSSRHTYCHLVDLWWHPVLRKHFQG